MTEHRHVFDIMMGMDSMCGVCNISKNYYQGTLDENKRVIDEVEKIDVLDFSIVKNMLCPECGKNNTSMYFGEREAEAEDEDDGSAYMCIKCHPMEFLKEIKRTLKDELASLRLEGGEKE